MKLKSRGQGRRGLYSQQKKKIVFETKLQIDADINHFHFSDHSE
jgi:hypothetical protein